MSNSSPLPEYMMNITGFVFYKVAEMSRQLYGHSLSPLGITEEQLGVMIVLQNVGPQVQARLSTPLRIDKATMVGIVNDLERQGLVKRVPHPQDRRAVQVHLTEAGSSMIGKAYEVSDNFVKQFFSVLSPEEQGMFHEMLVRLAKNAAPQADTILKQEENTRKSHE